MSGFERPSATSCRTASSRFVRIGRRAVAARSSRRRSSPERAGLHGILGTARRHEDAREHEARHRSLVRRFLALEELDGVGESKARRFDVAAVLVHGRAGDQRRAGHGCSANLLCERHEHL